MLFCIKHTIQLFDKKVMIAVQYKKNRWNENTKERMSADGGHCGRGRLQLSAATVSSGATDR